jgi:hypothetical protein
MEPNSYAGSAKIFAFPSGGREAEKVRREEAALKERGLLASSLGSGWYHESAIQAEQAPIAPAHATPWWVEAEHESQAKSFTRRAF